jgi:hypothetical protein
MLLTRASAWPDFNPQDPPLRDSGQDDTIDGLMDIDDEPNTISPSHRPVITFV